jgi:hypothetical protein
MRHAAGLCLALVLCVLPQPAAAWGFAAHQFIMGEVIPRLPAEIRPFFQANRTYLVEHVVDPDLWRTAGWEEEPRRHFLDMDAYGPYPFTDLPHDEAEAVAQRGREFVDRNGLLPWRAEEIYGNLVAAFRQDAPYARENLKFFAAVMTHYVSDANVPFHAATNYDGQLTGQWGIHARFESELFERNRTRLRLPAIAVHPVPSPREAMFGILTESFSLVDPILAADRTAVAGREFYDDGYFAALFRGAGPILERRLASSIAGAASFITAAWIEAGRPAVPVSVPRSVRPVRRQAAAAGPARATPTGASPSTARPDGEGAAPRASRTFPLPRAGTTRRPPPPR